MKTLLLIHHSHTDVGYTEMPGRVARWHAGFLRQALSIVAAGRHPGFRWNCETFWAVRQFLDGATEAERSALASAIREGRIGLSASWLNFSELPDLELLTAITRRAAAYGAEIGVPVDSAMTADVNGNGTGFGRALRASGVENLFTCVHCHHGRYPLDRPQRGFWWEMPDGERILVWSGEHYHYGNELGLSPGATASYLTKDECDAAMIFAPDPWPVAEIRIPRYWERLAAAGHDLDFAPMMISGLRTDNGPPSAAIAEMADRWNAVHGAECPVEMTTLSGFFARLRAAAPDLPVHRGDWPDWWSDGPAGDADATKLFRAAQRGLRAFEALRSARPEVPDESRDDVVDDLALYAEHTFSHSDSVSSPWHPLVAAISTRKRGYAARAFDRVTDLLDSAAAALGGGSLAPGMPLAWRVVNPWDEPRAGPVRLGVGHHEFHELRLDRGGAVVLAGSGAVLPSAVDAVPRGAEFVAWLSLPAGGEARLLVRPGETGPAKARTEADEGFLATPHGRIEWRAGEGISGWTAGDGRSLLRPDRPFGPFLPVREITPVAGRDGMCAVRGAMDRNRKGPDVARIAAVVRRARRLEAGAVSALVELECEMAGARWCAVEIRAWAAAARADVSVRYLKEARWEPENVYVPLPFGPGELRLHKAGAVVRPGRDQIPGTLTDFYAVQEGLSVGTIAVATPDAHLVQVGPLDPGPRLLAGDPGLADAPEHLFSWVQTNYWETNFAAELGGFHEFRYTVTWGPAAVPTDRELFVVREAAG